LIASDLTNPDFVRFAESFAAAAERAKSPDELRFSNASSQPGQPTVIELPVGPMRARTADVRAPDLAAGVPTLNPWTWEPWNLVHRRVIRMF